MPTRVFDRSFWRDGLVTLVATFLGAGLAFWTSQYQADQRQREDVASMLGFMQADCAQALNDLKGIRITNGPAVVTPTATLLTLATNPTFIGAISQDKREELVGAIYSFNRAGNDYLVAANTLDNYVKLHAGEFDRLDAGVAVTFIPGPPPQSAEEDARRRQAWEPGEKARKDELSNARTALRNDLGRKLRALEVKHTALCGVLKAASQG